MIIRDQEYYKHGIINKSTLYSLLMSSGSIVLNKNLMKSIGINESIIFCELLSRNNYFESRQQLTEDGFFFNTIENLEEATTLSGYQQRKAITSLIDIGLIEMKVIGLPARRYFKIIDHVEKLISLLDIKDNVSTLLKTSSEETKQLIPKKLDGNNTNLIIQKNDNDNDNGTLPCGKDSVKSVDVVNSMKTYMTDLYKQKTKKKHPVLKPEQYERVYESISSFADSYSLDYDGIVEVMLKYFNSKIETDWNINHFATEGIMLNRLYEIGVL